MRRVQLAVLSFPLVVACATTSSPKRSEAPPPPKDDKANVNISLDPKIASESGDTIGAAWLSYGMQLAVSWSRAKDANMAPDPFQQELEARQAMLRTWGELKTATPSLANPYLDELEAIEKSGFLTEYVVEHHAEPGWNLSGEAIAALRWKDFHALMERDFPKHGPETHAVVEVDHHFQQPPLPGAGLFKRADLDVRPKDCDTVVDTFPDRLARFEKDARAAAPLIYLPLTSRDFARILQDESLDETHRQRGVIWGSPFVGRAFYLAGFCAIELNDTVRGEQYLKTLLRFDPVNAQAIGELGHALTSQKRFGEALPLFERAVTLSEEGCQRARNLRQIGYTLIELGRLDEARQAYELSLVDEPGSEVAKKELRYIEELSARRKGTKSSSPAATATWVETVKSGRLHSTCTNKK